MQIKLLDPFITSFGHWFHLPMRLSKMWAIYINLVFEIWTGNFSLGGRLLWPLRHRFRSIWPGLNGLHSFLIATNWKLSWKLSSETDENENGEWDEANENQRASSSKSGFGLLKLEAVIVIRAVWWECNDHLKLWKLSLTKNEAPRKEKIRGLRNWERQRMRQKTLCLVRNFTSKSDGPWFESS